MHARHGAREIPWADQTRSLPSWGLQSGLQGTNSEQANKDGNEIVTQCEKIWEEKSAAGDKR